MAESGFKKRYTCVDTFDGFTDDDLSHEFRDRKNEHRWIENLFEDNDVAWFRESLASRSITDVNIIMGDIAKVSNDQLPEKIAFCLIDVDLYQPVAAALRKIYPRLSEGGVIIVDDCWTKDRHLFVERVGEAYDGAMQAYREFIAELGHPEELVETKLAVVRKPRSQ